MTKTIKELIKVAHYSASSPQDEPKVSGYLTGIYEIIDLRDTYSYLVARCPITYKVYVVKRECIKKAKVTLLKETGL